MHLRHFTLITMAFFALAFISCPDPNSGSTEKTIVSIAIATQPANTQYQKGDTQLDLTGMVVTAYYNDSSSEAITDYTTSGFSTDTGGYKTITLSYNGKTATFTINVFDPDAETAETPKASPAGGAFAETVLVTISSATAGGEIRYTTDGSDPTSASTLYTAPLP